VLEHVKWFTDAAAYPTQYDRLLSLPVIAAALMAIAAVAVAWWIQHNVPEPAAVRVLERFAGYGPLALGVHVGTALIAAAALGLLFVPSLRVEPDMVGSALLVMEAVAGISILLGLATRAGAAILALLGVLAMWPFTVESILEQVPLLGIAVFLFLIGRGPLSFDRLRGVRPPLRGDLVPYAALVFLRILMGFGIAYNALTEKLLNEPLARSLLERYPHIALNRAVGAPDELFIWLAGAAELAIGAVIMSGQITRPVMAAGATLFVFGWPELLGHLPLYGIMLLLLIAPNADTWGVRRALRPGA
jgi:uncharacterized membrane protein YphA (DoxX/SURF4 family)